MFNSCYLGYYDLSVSSAICVNNRVYNRRRRDRILLRSTNHVNPVNCILSLIHAGLLVLGIMLSEPIGPWMTTWESCSIPLGGIKTLMWVLLFP